MTQMVRFSGCKEMKNFRERGTLQYIEQKFQAMVFVRTASGRKTDTNALWLHVRGAILTGVQLQLSVHSFAAS